MQAGKEMASNVAASARAGMEKSKAVALEKIEQMKTRDPMMKDMATQKKEAKIDEAEREKQGAMQQNRLAKHEGDAGGYGHGFTAIGDPTTAHTAGRAGGAHVGHGTHVPETDHAGGDHVPGSDYTTGGDHVPGTGHAAGIDHVSGTGHAAGIDHTSGTGHAAGIDHTSGTGHAAGMDHTSGTGHAAGMDHTSGASHTGLGI